MNIISVPSGSIRKCAETRHRLFRRASAPLPEVSPPSSATSDHRWIFVITPLPSQTRDNQPHLPLTPAAQATA